MQGVYWQARLLLAAVDFMGGYYAFRDAFVDFADGSILAGIVDIGLRFQNAFSSANGARAARARLQTVKITKQGYKPKK